MRSVALTASLAAALWLGVPAPALAQEPDPAPAPSPAPDPPVKPVRDYAVPRSERGAAREPQPAERAPQPARQPQAVPREAKPASAARPDSGDAGRRRALANASSAPANVSDGKADDQERRGAVRRPPSGDSGRSGRPQDRAVPRASVPRQDRDRDRDWGRRVYVYPDYWGSRFYDPYYSGLGYFYYSPWGWTPSFYGHPYSYGYGSGSGYSGRYVPRGWDVGAVKLKVEPQDAEVYVDGYYAGQVDDFDGFWQSLKLDSGAYRIEVRKPGFETLQFDVRVQPDRTITFRGDMRPVP